MTQTSPYASCCMRDPGLSGLEVEEPTWKKRSRPHRATRKSGGMSTTTTMTAATAAAIPSGRRSVAGSLLSKPNLSPQALRIRPYVIPTLAFPLVFYMLSAWHSGRGQPALSISPTYLIATYGASE